MSRQLFLWRLSLYHTLNKIQEKNNSDAVILALNIKDINILMSCCCNHASMNGFLIYKHSKALLLQWDMRFLRENVSSPVRIVQRILWSSGFSRDKTFIKQMTSKLGWILHLHVSCQIFYDWQHSYTLPQERYKRGVREVVASFRALDSEKHIIPPLCDLLTKVNRDSKWATEKMKD